MGRKKKRKKRSAPKQAAEPNSPAAEPQEPVAPPEATASVAIADAPPAPASPPAPPLPTAPPGEPDDPVADLDADSDDAGDYESLVAQVAGLPDEPRRLTPAVGRTSRRIAPAPADDVEVLDLDDEEGTSEAVDRLIAKAVVGAPREAPEPEPDVPLIDLDADEAVAPARPRLAAGAPSTGQPPSRLVAAAAAGAIEDDDGPGIPLDLGEISTPEARARLLAETLAHAEHKEARYRVPLSDTRPARRWKSLAATALFLLASIVAVAPPAWVSPVPPAQLNAAARARGLRMALLLQAQQVEAFRVRSQRLPTSLDELPAVLSGVRYARSGNRAYQLIAYESDGNAIVYDSANPAPPFRMLMSAWGAVENTP